MVIELESVPDHFKTMELLCGGELRYDEHYPSPARLAIDLQIDDAQFVLEQPIGPNDDWNQGHSTVTYYRESVAVEQAQLMWNKSRIAEYFGKGKLRRARYGVQEVETGYTAWLGACEDPERPWERERSRAEYMARKAEELTLANALDINGFRAFLKFQTEAMDDEWLLSALHHRRARSPAIPADVRAESERWLREHDHEIGHRSRER